MGKMPTQVQASPSHPPSFPAPYPRPHPSTGNLQDGAATFSQQALAKDRRVPDKWSGPVQDSGSAAGGPTQAETDTVPASRNTRPGAALSKAPALPDEWSLSLRAHHTGQQACALSPPHPVLRQQKSAGSVS